MTSGSSESEFWVPPMPAVPGVTHRRVRIGDLRIHVAEAGAGPPLVMLHGWPQHWYCWRHVVPLLAADFRLIMPDLRGFGWSDVPSDGYDKEQLATDLLDLLDALELDRVDLVGHDWGGWTGFLSCLREPDRFRAFLALGIIHPFQRPTPMKLAQAWRGAYQVAIAAPLVSRLAMQTSPILVDSMVRAAGAPSTADLDPGAPTYGQILQQPARAQASVQMYRTFLTREVPHLRRYLSQRLTVPTRLVIGGRDPIGSAALLDGWQDHADDMSVDVIPDAGHFRPEEIPDRVAELIREHLGAGIDRG